MLKVVGCLCILIGGGAARMLLVNAARGEIAALSDLLSALRTMEDEIRLNRTPLPRLLTRLAAGREGAAAAYFRAVAAAARRGEPLPEIWKREAVQLPLKKNELAVWEELGDKLSGDEESVLKALEFAGRQLLRTLEKKREQQSDQEKRSTALCFSSAALLIILLI